MTSAAQVLLKKEDSYFVSLSKDELVRDFQIIAKYARSLEAPAPKITGKKRKGEAVEASTVSPSTSPVVDFSAAVTKMKATVFKQIKSQLKWGQPIKEGKATWKFVGGCGNPALFYAFMGNGVKFQRKKLAMTRDDFEKLLGHGFLQNDLKYAVLAIGDEVNATYDATNGEYSFSGRFGKTPKVGQQMSLSEMRFAACGGGLVHLVLLLVCFQETSLSLGLPTKLMFQMKESTFSPPSPPLPVLHPPPPREQPESRLLLLRLQWMLTWCSHLR